MALPGFIFGGDTGVTPEKLKRDRAIADALMANSARAGAPRNVGEGLSAVGQALMYRAANARAGKGEAVQADKQAGIWSALTSAMSGGAAMPFSGGSTSADGAASSAPFSGGSITPPSASSPAGGARAAADGGKSDWLRYANEGATRNLPLDGGLVSALSFLPELGVTAEVYSGGQPAKGSGGARVGSTRHDHGHAGDMRFYREGRQLDWANAEDRPVFEEIVRRGRANGITGFGAGPGYMGAGTMHVGMGAPGVWGEGGRSANAPDWLRSAYYSEAETSAPVQVASLDPSIGMAQSAPSKDAAVGQALGLAPTTQPARLSPAAAALNGIAPAPQETPAPQAQTMTAQPQQAPQPVQYAQAQPSAGGMNPQALLSVMSDPWASDEQRQVAQFVMQQQMAQQQAAQTRAYEAQQQRQLWAREDARNSVTDRREDARLGMEMGQFERDGSKPIEVNGVLLDPQTYQPVYQAPAEGFTLNSGQTRFDGDGRQIAAGAPEAPNVPTGVQEYQFAVSQGYTGSFADWEQSNRRAGATTINTGQDEGEFQKKAAGRMVERFGTLADAGVGAASVLQTLPQMRELLSVAPQGPVTGRLAEMFPGFSSAADAFTATVNQIAPSLRIPGSGAQSDKDMDILLGSFPRMRNDPQANILIMEAFQTKAQINLQRSEIATAALRGEISPAEADQRIAELDRTSIIPEGMRQRLGVTQAPETGMSPNSANRPRATNPQTGEIIEFDGTQWVPAR